MYYVYTYIIPIIILGIVYLLNNQKPQTVSDYVDVLFKSLPHEFGYTFFIYYIGEEQHVDTGWSFLSLMIMLIPLSGILLALKIFYWIYNRNRLV